MNRIIKKGLILFTITYIGLAVYLWFDDSLTPLSEEIASFQINQQPYDNGEVYLWCISCKTDDVYSAGAKLVNRVNEIIKSKRFDEDFETGYEHLEFLNKEILCQKFKADCNVIELSQTIDFALLQKESSWAVDRYLTYLNFQHYLDQTYPHFAAPISNLWDLQYAQATFHLSLLFENTDSVALAHTLTQELIDTKRILGKLDSLLHRMILVILISENIEFVNQLIQRGLIDRSDLSDYSLTLNLSSQHYDLSAPLKRELVAELDLYDQSYLMSNTIDNKNTSFINKMIQKVLIKFVYKQNMVRNHLAFYTEKALAMTVLEPHQFFESARTLPEKNEVSQFRNFLGHKAMKNLKPRTWNEYIARIHSLHNKMLLLKSLIHYGSYEEIKKRIGSTDFSYKSLYNSTLPYFEKDNYCFNSPDNIHIRLKDICIRILNSDE